MTGKWPSTPGLSGRSVPCRQPVQRRRGDIGANPPRPGAQLPSLCTQWAWEPGRGPRPRLGSPSLSFPASFVLFILWSRTGRMFSRVPVTGSWRRRPAHRPGALPKPLVPRCRPVRVGAAQGPCAQPGPRRVAACGGSAAPGTHATPGPPPASTLCAARPCPPRAPWPRRLRQPQPTSATGAAPHVRSRLLVSTRGQGAPVATRPRTWSRWGATPRPRCPHTASPPRPRPRPLNTTPLRSVARPPRPLPQAHRSGPGHTQVQLVLCLGGRCALGLGLQPAPWRGPSAPRARPHPAGAWRGPGGRRRHHGASGPSAGGQGVGGPSVCGQRHTTNASH